MTEPRTPTARARSEALPSEPKPATLAAALLAFQADLPSVHKGNVAMIPTKSGGSYSYKYADLSDVSDAVIPRLNSFGVTFTARPRQTQTGGYELVGVLRHADSGETDEGSLPLFGREMQELGGSITYARRYLLGCMTGILTDEDEDNAWTAAKERVKAEQPPPPPPASQAPPLPEPTPLRRTEEADELAATASLLQDLEGIAASQNPPRDLAWITSRLRHAAGGLEVSDLYSLAPEPLETLVHRWQQTPPS